MGFSIKFNWVLQMSPPEGIEPGRIHPFNKTGNRIFPLDTPIDLIDADRNAVAKIKVKSFTNESGITTGLFQVIKNYTGNEKVVLTNYWRENQ